MKTPWSNLIQYGIGVATIIVISLSAICLLLVVGAAAVISKLLVFIK